MRRILLAAALLGIFFTASAQQNARLTLIDPPVVTEESVSLGVRVTGIDPRQLAAFSAANFLVNEPFTDLNVTADPRLPVTLGVVVNLSVNTELLLIKRTLHAYFDAHYRAGDAVIFTLLTVPQPYTVAAGSKAEIDAIIDGLQLSTVYYSVGDALPAVAEGLVQAREDDPERAVMGLLVTSFINATPAESAAADSFAAAGIPLHIVQAHTFRGEFTETLRGMAIRTGGIFVNNHAGLLVTGEPPTAVGALKVLFDALDSSRIVFDVSYRSTSLDLTREPTVTLSVQLTSERILTLPFSYERYFAAPVIQFSNPSITATRRPSRIEGGGTAFDVASQEIAVYVRFPDAVPRRVETLELQVYDQARETVIQTHLLTDPQRSADGAYRITWALDNYDAPGTNTPVILSVSATDELGLTGSAEQVAGVVVAALPPLPTATFTPIPTATATPLPPTPTVAPTVAVVPTPISIDVGDRMASLFGYNLPVSTDALTIVLGVIALAATLFAVVLMRRLRHVSAELEHVSDEGAYAASRMDMPTPLPDGGTNGAGAAEEYRIYGRLYVKRGIPSQQIVIDAPDFVIGRKAGEGVHLAIDAPFISPRHCTISFREDRFLIRDLNSKNGTFVNGERIIPERDTIVPNGSEIEITRHIVFELWDPDTSVDIDYQMDDVNTERLNSRISTTAADSVAFPSALGIRAADDDDGEISDDYSPV